MRFHLSLNKPLEQPRARHPKLSPYIGRCDVQKKYQNLLFYDTYWNCQHRQIHTSRKGEKHGATACGNSTRPHQIHTKWYRISVTTNQTLSAQTHTRMYTAIQQPFICHRQRELLRWLSVRVRKNQMPFKTVYALPIGDHWFYICRSINRHTHTHTYIAPHVHIYVQYCWHWHTRNHVNKWKI